MRDLREQRVGADLLGAHHERARLIDGGAGDRIAGALLDRHRLAGDHRLVDDRVALEDDAVHRHLGAGPHAQGVAGVHFRELDLALGAVRLDADRGVRGEAEQRAHRARGLRPRAQLEHLTEQHQRGDDGRRLEVEGHETVRLERLGERARHEHREDAEEVGDRDAKADEAVHVEPQRPERHPRALEERPAAPEHDRRGERELPPGEERLVHRVPEFHAPDHLGHRGRNEGQAQRDAHPEAPRHVLQMDVLDVRERGGARLERHAADRAVAGRVAHDLGVHRAGPLDVRARGHSRERGGRSGPCGREPWVAMVFRAWFQPRGIVVRAVGRVVVVVSAVGVFGVRCCMLVPRWSGSDGTQSRIRTRHRIKGVEDGTVENRAAGGLAGVGVETIRYYQRRKLLATPAQTLRQPAHYPPAFVDRLRFIKRAQALGFSLDDVAVLLQLNDGTGHVRARRLASRRLAEIESRIVDLAAITRVLEHLIRDCEHADGRRPCPIIATLLQASADVPPRGRTQ